MASTYPGTIDNFTRPLGTGTHAADNCLTHKDYHDNAFDGIEAIQAELGVDPAGTDATVRARLDRLEPVIQFLTTNKAKTSDNDVADGTGDTDNFEFAYAASTWYHMEANLYPIALNASGTTGDVAVALHFTNPAVQGAAAASSPPKNGTWLDTQSETLNLGIPLTGQKTDFGVVNNLAVTPLRIIATFLTAGSAGTLKLNWAQADSDTVSTTMYAGSHVRLIEIPI
jgi:hypothetical protein